MTAGYVWLNGNTQTNSVAKTQTIQQQVDATEQNNTELDNNTIKQPSAVSNTTANTQMDEVKIPLSEISTTAKYYTYDSGGIAIKYFAVKGSDGKVRTAFDACEVCYRAKKGYSQVGSSMKCNNCGLQFRIDDLGTMNKGSGCWPAYLPNEVSGSSIIIKKTDLDKGAYLF